MWDKSTLHKELHEAYREFAAERKTYLPQVLRSEDIEALNSLGWELTMPKERMDEPNHPGRQAPSPSLTLAAALEIEHLLCASYFHQPAEEDHVTKITDASGTIQNMLTDSSENCRHMLLSLARRAASDLYYMVAARNRYYQQQEYQFSRDFPLFCNQLATSYSSHCMIHNIFSQNSELTAMIQETLLPASNSLGITVKDQDLRSWIPENDDDSMMLVTRLKKYMTTLFVYRNRIKDDFSFLRYYFNERDGKGYRYQFTMELLEAKKARGEISPLLPESFGHVYRTFRKLSSILMQMSLEDFGPRDFTYRQIVILVYGAAKFLEYIYLRNGNHEDLKLLRSEVYYHIEKELMQYKTSTDERRN